MKGKLVKLILIIVLIICIAIGVWYFIKNKDQNNEYTEYQPQEEISEEQERQTLVSLYFANKTTKRLEPEARLIDVKELVTNPYEKLINMLIDGPKNDNHEKTIPEGTKLLKAEIEGDILKLDLSAEFIENHKGGKEEEEKTIESIVNTLTELTEVNSIKILINGEENQKFKDGELDFARNFIRND